MVLTVLILSALNGCDKDVEQPDLSIDITEEAPDDEAWSFHLIMTSNGIKTAEIRSGYMAHFESSGEYELSDSVVADFYEQGDHTSKMTADNATINNLRDDLLARKNVVVVSDSGLTLLTELLKWDNERGIIFTEEFVTFITETDTLYGHGFESDRSLKNYRIFNPTGNILIRK